MVSEDFFPMESLAQGGLGAGWGLGTYVYSEAELEKAGLPQQEMKNSYQKNPYSEIKRLYNQLSDITGLNPDKEELVYHIETEEKATQLLKKMLFSRPYLDIDDYRFYSLIRRLNTMSTWMIFEKLS